MSEDNNAAVCPPITFLTQAQAKLIDDELMGEELGFSTDQLMELAGLSVACAVQKEFQPCRVLVICGPGNNGGDGLVAARHLKHFGFDPVVCYPKQTDKPLYRGLVKQCDGLDIQVSKDMPDIKSQESFGLIVDAIFGYSFTGEIRAPFDSIIPLIRACPIPVVAVDIPSGWDVEKGDAREVGVKPVVIVSLTAPKKGVESFEGIHYVGGRFVAPKFAEKHKITLPTYEGCEQVVKL